MKESRRPRGAVEASKVPLADERIVDRIISACGASMMLRGGSPGFVAEELRMDGRRSERVARSSRARAREPSRILLGEFVTHELAPGAKLCRKKSESAFFPVSYDHEHKHR